MAAGTNNTAVQQLLPLGACSSLATRNFIVVNEVTTVGMVAALYPYITAYNSVGSTAAHAADLVSRFNTAAEYVNASNGRSPGPALPAGSDASTADLNSLANTVSACVNTSGYVNGNGGICDRFFTDATPPANATRNAGVKPSDTVTALLNISNNPDRNVVALYNLSPPIGAFAPVSTYAPPDWTLPITVTPAPRSGPVVTSSVVSASSSPDVVTTFGSLAFVSVQGTGAIDTFDISSGTPVPVSQYSTPCHDPSGMVITTIADQTVMAVPCYDTDSLLTLNVAADGTLSPLGSVGGLPAPFPGTALDGTDVYIPLFGTTLTQNGSVAKVSIASPANPVVTAVTTLESPPAGGVVNPGFLALHNGYVYVAAGSENDPRGITSTLQVLRETDLTIQDVLQVDHSPQAIGFFGDVAIATIYDAGEVQSFDVSDPTNVRLLQTLAISNCNPLAFAVVAQHAYVGCYEQATVQRIDVSTPSAMVYESTLSGVRFPERFAYSAVCSTCLRPTRSPVAACSRSIRRASNRAALHSMRTSVWSCSDPTLRRI